MKPHDMGVLFDECAEQARGPVVHLDRPFDIAPDAGTAYTPAGLAELVVKAAGWLAGAGAGPGQRIAIVKDNHWDYDLLACAAVRLGAVPAQLSGHLPPEWLQLLLNRLEPTVLVTTSTLLTAAEQAGVDLSSFAGTTVALDGPATGAIGVQELFGSSAPAPHHRDADAPLIINHTSGTTGVPKLVAHSTRSLMRGLARFEAHRLPMIGMRADDTVANANAYAHGRTFCWTVVLPRMAPREVLILTDHDPDRADPLLRAHPPTITEALPSTFVRFEPLADRLHNPFRRTRLFLSTYDAIHPPTIRSFLNASQRWFPVWMQGWGQTETGPLTHRFHTRGSMAVDRGDRPTTRDVGRPVPGRTRLRVVDPVTFEPVRRGEPGLVLTRTQARCLDYIGEAERWQGKDAAGWWNTGDIAIRRRTGRLLLLDREIDHAPRLSCLQTEDVLEDRLTEARECVVLTRPGNDPLPVVVTASGTLPRTSWRTAARGLPSMAAPVAMTWDEVPRTDTGKVRRQSLLQKLTGRSETCGSGTWT